MQTTMMRFHPDHYIPNVMVNILEKLEELPFVREVVRPTPFGLMVTTKNRRGIKRMLHVLSFEMRAMHVEVIVPAKQKKYNPYN